MKRLVIRTALVLFLLTWLLPPWLETYDKNGPNGGHTRRSVGHGFILTPPQFSDENRGVRLDFGVLLFEWIGLAALAASPFVWEKFKK